MFCSKCGKENQDTSRYCICCGTQLKGNDIKKRTFDYSTIYLVFIITSNVLLLFSGVFPILSVYSWYDYREHECGFFSHLFSKGYLEYQISELVNKYHEMEYDRYSYVVTYFKQEYIPSLFCCVFMVASLAFAIMSILFSLSFLYKLVMGNRGLALIKVSTGTVVCGTIYLGCLLIYTYIPFMGEKDCEIKTLGLVLLVYTIINMVFIQREYLKKYNEIETNESKGSINNTIFITISIIILISVVGAIIGISMAGQQLKTPLYSEEYGWKIEGQWAYQGEEKIPFLEVEIKQDGDEHLIRVIDWDMQKQLFEKKIEFCEMNEYVINIDSERGYMYALNITPRKMWLSIRGNEKKYELNGF